MRDILNLKALKKDGNAKHKKIYHKAHKIMEMGFETEILTENEILEKAKKYPHIKVKVTIGGDIIVRSKRDTWLIKDEGRFITLYHKKTIFVGSKIKDSYHVQDVFYDLDFVFASIVSHDDYAINGRVRNVNDINTLIREHGRP